MTSNQVAVALDLCPECNGEGDGMDDAFYCGSCKGDHMVCGDCGRRLAKCGCTEYPMTGVNPGGA